MIRLERSTEKIFSDEDDDEVFQGITAKDATAAPENINNLLMQWHVFMHICVHK